MSYPLDFAFVFLNLLSTGELLLAVFTQLCVLVLASEA